MENRFNMKKEELIDPVYEKQEGEKPAHYREFCDFLLFPGNNLKKFYDDKIEKYEFELKKYEENIEIYNSLILSTPYLPKTPKIKKPVRPKKPYTYFTYKDVSSDNYWFYRKKIFNAEMEKDIISICRSIIRSDLASIFNKQTELYKKALDKLYDDLLKGKINWSQFSHGVNGLYKLYGLILLFQDKSTDKKEVDVKSENELKISPVKSREEMEEEYEAVIKQYLQETADG